MSSSHELCPVCKKDMMHNPKVCLPCPLLNKTRFSFVESCCNIPTSNINDQNDSIKFDNPNHLFFQITSLYGELLFEKISFPISGTEISVNYVLYESKLTYFTKEGPPDIVTIPNKLVVLDYPNLEIAKSKIKTMAMFL